MNITIQKRFDFDACHWLPAMPEGHKCKRVHGHTYSVEVTLTGALDESTGLLVDYADIVEPIHPMLDHRTLNDVPGLANPTTEVLVHWMLGVLNKRLPARVETVHVRVYESSTTYAEATLARGAS